MNTNNDEQYLVHNEQGPQLQVTMHYNNNKQYKQ